MAELNLELARSVARSAIQRADTIPCERGSPHGFSLDTIKELAAMVLNLADRVPTVRQVTPLECPECSALWLFWPKEQSSFDKDSLTLKSRHSCAWCEPRGVEGLRPLGKAAACPECKGNGSHFGTWCEKCNGTGGVRDQVKGGGDGL